MKSKIGDVKIFHFRDTDFTGIVQNTGGVTYAFAKNSQGEWIYTTARCSCFDNFSKRIGRAIAIGRLEKGRKTHQWGNKEPTYEEVEKLEEELSATQMNKMLSEYMPDTLSY